MDGGKEKKIIATHARSDTITPTAFAGVSVILSSVRPPPSPPFAGVKDHRRNQRSSRKIKEEELRTAEQWPMSCSQRFLEESWRQGATQGPSLPEG